MSMLANLKHGFAMIRDAVPMSYYSLLQPVRQFFSQDAIFKSKYHYPQLIEDGYRDLKHKEMFFVRNKQFPNDLTLCAGLMEDLHNISLQCLRMVSDELQIENNKLLTMVDAKVPGENTSSILRLIHYRAGIYDANDHRANTCDVHQDLGLLTLICPTDVPALEIYDFTDKGAWLDIEMTQGVEDLIVMVGESLSLISNNYFLPCTHRVRITQKPRVSIFYQLRFKNDALINSQNFETMITGKFSKPFCMTGAEYLNKEIGIRRSVNGSY